MDPSKFLLLARGSRTEGPDSKCGLLYEAAPDSSSRPKNRDVVPVEELLGPRQWAEDRAAQLVSKLVADSALYAGLPVLSLVEELMMHEFVGIFQSLRLDSILRGSQIASCQLRGDRSWFDRLSLARQVTASPYRLEFEECGTGGVAQKLAREYSGILRTNWLRVAKFAVRRIAPLQSIWMESRFSKSAPVSKGGVWFLGAAYNTMAIGLQYGSALGEVKYSFVDPGEGGRKLRERGVTGVPIFQFARLRDLPARAEIKKIAELVAEQLKAIPLCGDEEHARNIYAQSASFDYLLRRILPWTIGIIHVSQRMLEITQPDLIVVGNAAFERPLLLLAKHLGIPTVMLQHGVVHSYYRVLDQPVDHFLVRGEFFQNCLGPALKAKAAVLDIPDSPPPRRSQQRGTDILFITSPIEVEARADFREVGEIISVLLGKASECSARVVIRVHPTETVGRYRRLIEPKLRALNPAPKVLYSQQTPIAPVLQTSAVAVLFHSTLFLECLAAGVPMISPGWHDFPFKGQYIEERIFNFAENLAQLGSLVVRGVYGELEVRQDQLERFLQPTQKTEVLKFFKSLFRYESGQCGC